MKNWNPWELISLGGVNVFKKESSLKKMRRENKITFVTSFYTLVFMLTFCPSLQANRRQEPNSAAQEDVISWFLKEKDIEQKERALRAITQMPDSGPKLLEIARSSNNIHTKYLALRGLGEIKFHPAKFFLIKSLSHIHPWIRANAARALGDMEISEAIPILITTLKKEKNSGVIEQTSFALGNLQAREALPELKRTTSRLKVSRSSQTLIWVIQSIGRLGSDAEVPFLASYLDYKDSYVCVTAATGIQHITGADLGFPLGPDELNNPGLAIQKARRWWVQNKNRYQR